MSNGKLAPSLVVLLTILAACTSPKGPQGSLVKTPSSWGRLGGAAQTADLEAPLATGPEVEIDHRWWKHFDDPVLDALITEALAGNKTLQIAKARVEEARAARKGAQALLLPQVNAGLGGQRTNLGYFTGDEAIGFSEVGGVASWELDLFGRNQARTAAATGHPPVRGGGPPGGQCGVVGRGRA